MTEIDRIIKNQAIIMEGLAAILTAVAAPPTAENAFAISDLLREAAKENKEYSRDYRKGLLND